MFEAFIVNKTMSCIPEGKKQIYVYFHEWMKERMNELIDHMSDWRAPKSFFSRFHAGK